jgi:hypothetical protein
MNECGGRGGGKHGHASHGFTWPWEDDEMGSPPHVFGFASKKKKENLK